jgi:hypothetical protein
MSRAMRGDTEEVQRLTLRSRRIIHLVASAVAVWPSHCVAEAAIGSPTAICVPSFELRLFDADQATDRPDALITTIPLSRPPTAAPGDDVWITHVDLSFSPIMQAKHMSGASFAAYHAHMDRTLQTFHVGSDGVLVLGWSDGTFRRFAMLVLVLMCVQSLSSHLNC